MVLVLLCVCGSIHNIRSADQNKQQTTVIYFIIVQYIVAFQFSG